MRSLPRWRRPGKRFGEPDDRCTVDAEHGVDRLRAKFGDGAVVRGLAFDKEED
jgi:hypothetical protein